MNNITIVGRVVRDFSLKQTQSGVSVATMCVAVDKRNRQDGADFFDVVAWRGTAENCAKFLGKGSQVAVKGRMESRKWQTKDGDNRTSWEIQADDVEFIGGKKEAGNSEQGNVFESSDPVDSPMIDNDDLPF